MEIDGDFDDQLAKASADIEAKSNPTRLLQPRDNAGLKFLLKCCASESSDTINMAAPAVASGIKGRPSLYVANAASLHKTSS